MGRSHGIECEGIKFLGCHPIPRLDGTAPGPGWDRAGAGGGDSGWRAWQDSVMASRASSADLLASVPLFSACSKKELAGLARAAEERSVPAGTVVVREGAAGDAFYVLVSGQARIERSGRAVATIGPGDFFGDLALLDRAPRNATVTTTADTVLVVLGQRTFLAMVDESPAFARKLLLGLARRLRAVDAQARP